MFIANAADAGYKAVLKIAGLTMNFCMLIGLWHVRMYDWWVDWKHYQSLYKGGVVKKKLNWWQKLLLHLVGHGDKI